MAAACTLGSSRRTGERSTFESRGSLSSTARAFSWTERSRAWALPILRRDMCSHAFRKAGSFGCCRIGARPFPAITSTTRAGVNLPRHSPCWSRLFDTAEDSTARRRLGPEFTLLRAQRRHLLARLGLQELSAFLPL